MVTAPARWAACDDENSAGAPSQSSTRLFVDMSPLKIMMSLLLPEPFAPTNAWISPGHTHSEQELERDRPVERPTKFMRVEQAGCDRGSRGDHTGNVLVHTRMLK
jgi:hypothetical protein